jgi:hypothetical protein
MAISVFFAFIVSLLFESPFIGLEKMIFGASPGKSKAKSPTTIIIKSAEVLENPFNFRLVMPRTR